MKTSFFVLTFYFSLVIVTRGPPSILCLSVANLEFPSSLEGVRFSVMPSYWSGSTQIVFSIPRTLSFVYRVRVVSKILSPVNWDVASLRAELPDSDVARFRHSDSRWPVQVFFFSLPSGFVSIVTRVFFFQCNARIEWEPGNANDPSRPRVF